MIPWKRSKEATTDEWAFKHFSYLELNLFCALTKEEV